MTNIEKGKEINRDVKVPAYVGTRQKDFCCEEHAGKYEQELEERMSKPGKSGGCCG